MDKNTIALNTIIIIGQEHYFLQWLDEGVKGLDYIIYKCTPSIITTLYYVTQGTTTSDPAKKMSEDNYDLDILTDQEYPEEEETTTNSNTGKVKPSSAKDLDKYLTKDTISTVRDQIRAANLSNICPVCDIAFSQGKETRRRHIWDHNCYNICQCGYITGKIESLMTHQRRKHQGADRGYHRVDAASHPRARREMLSVQLPREPPIALVNQSTCTRLPSQQARAIPLYRIPTPKKRKSTPDSNITLSRMTTRVNAELPPLKPAYGPQSVQYKGSTTTKSSSFMDNSRSRSRGYGQRGYRQ